MLMQLWPALVICSLGGWITFTLLFIFTSFPEKGVFLPRPALRWGLLSLGCYALWIVGMLRA